jgi:hypothetical protein
MTEVSKFRLYVLRGTYLIGAVGLAVSVWPVLLDHSPDWARTHGTVGGIMAGLSVLSLLGLRYPLKMLPILVFELVWKSIYLSAVSLPSWRAGEMDANLLSNAKTCLGSVIVLLIILPWPYLFTHYIKAPAEGWRGAAPPPP